MKSTLTTKQFLSDYEHSRQFFLNRIHSYSELGYISVHHATVEIACSISDFSSELSEHVITRNLRNRVLRIIVSKYVFADK